MHCLLEYIKYFSKEILINIIIKINKFINTLIYQ